MSSDVLQRIGFISFLLACLAHSQDSTDIVDTGCYPPCRSGYTCHQGNCISLCNPPCPAGSKCSSTGECISDYSAVAYSINTNCIGKINIFAFPKDALITIENTTKRYGGYSANIPCGNYKVTCNYNDTVASQIVKVEGGNETKLNYRMVPLFRPRLSMSYANFTSRMSEVGYNGYSIEAALPVPKRWNFGICYSQSLGSRYHGFIGGSQYREFTGDASVIGGGVFGSIRLSIQEFFIMNFGLMAGYWDEKFDLRYEYDDAFTHIYAYHKGHNSYSTGTKIDIQLGFKQLYLTGGVESLSCNESGNNNSDQGLVIAKAGLVIILSK